MKPIHLIWWMVTRVAVIVVVAMRSRLVVCLSLGHTTTEFRGSFAASTVTTAKTWSLDTDEHGSVAQRARHGSSGASTNIFHYWPRHWTGLDVSGTRINQQQQHQHYKKN